MPSRAHAWRPALASGAGGQSGPGRQARYWGARQAPEAAQRRPALRPSPRQAPHCRARPPCTPAPCAGASATSGCRRCWGRGGMSSVVHCVCARSGAQAAIKMYHRERLSPMNVKQAGVSHWRAGAMGRAVCGEGEPPHRACGALAAAAAAAADTPALFRPPCLPFTPLQVAREIEIHASLLHPHVLRLYAAFEDADGIYLVQEYAARGGLRAGKRWQGWRRCEGGAAGRTAQASAAPSFYPLSILPPPPSSLPPPCPPPHPTPPHPTHPTPPHLPTPQATCTWS